MVRSRRHARRSARNILGRHSGEEGMAPMGWKKLLVAATAGVVAGTAVVGGPAAAAPGDAGSSQVVTSWAGTEVYVSRQTTHNLAAKVREWDRTSDLPVTLMATLGCARLGNPVAMGVCGVVVPVFGFYAIDRLLQAGRQNACLRLAMTWTGPGLDVDDGPHCA